MPKYRQIAAAHGDAVQRLLGLAPYEHVHHKDGNHKNDHPSNLVITTPEDHLRWHHSGRKQVQPKVNERVELSLWKSEILYNSLPKT